ncbi:uncharacterized protein TNIN_183662, partial [Trichonephila inaurata madagascariensis]
MRDRDPFVIFGSSRAEEVPSSNESAATSLYIGVFVAVTVFIIVLVVLVWMVKRIKSRDPSMYRVPAAS